jgi:proline iminopeptidase
MTMTTRSSRRERYPPIEPWDHGWLDADAGHLVYWERVGTRGATPAVFLHGGPGAGCSPEHRRLFDPARYDLTLFDQRGCGRSTPAASLEANTTWDLVRDIEVLRQLAGVERWLVFGGSWGSTLALAYAQAHPERVTALVLRGVFLMRPAELRWYYQEGASWLFPDEWERFLAAIPEPERGDLLGAFHRRLTGDDGAARFEAGRAWSRWEGSTITLLPDTSLVDHFSDPGFADALARIETHYFANGAWLHENQLLSDVGRIRSIPAVIVQGRYDAATPMRSAWDLHRAWPEADLHVVPDGGHAYSEPGILDHLLDATDRFASG